MKHKFSSIDQPTRESKRVPKRKTIAKRAVLERYESIEDARRDALDLFAELLKSGNRTEKIIALKEISKFLFQTKQNIQGNFDGQIKIVFENIKD